MPTDGDSGSGIFDAHGDLVGIYVGYYTYDTGERVGVAEAPADAMRDAMTMPDSAAPVAYNGSSHHGRKLAGSNTNITQAAAITPRTGHPMPRFDFDFLISPLTKK